MVAKYAEGEPAPEPLAAVVSDDRVIQEFLKQLREQNGRAPAVDWLKIAPYVCAILTIVSGILAVGMWRMIDQITDTAKLAAANEAGIKRIDADRAGRIVSTNVRLDALDRKTQPIDLMLKDIARIDGAQERISTNLDDGRKERVSDINQIKDQLAALRQDIALLRQAMEARGQTIPRKPAFEMTPGLPPFLKARSTVRFRKGRPVTFLAALTRSLERTFGRPYYRGRYLASLRSARR